MLFKLSIIQALTSMIPILCMAADLPHNYYSNEQISNFKIQGISLRMSIGQVDQFLRHNGYRRGAEPNGFFDETIVYTKESPFKSVALNITFGPRKTRMISEILGQEDIRLSGTSSEKKLLSTLFGYPTYIDNIVNTNIWTTPEGPKSNRGFADTSNCLSNSVCIPPGLPGICPRSRIYMTTTANASFGDGQDGTKRLYSSVEDTRVRARVKYGSRSHLPYRPPCTASVSPFIVK